MKKIKSLLPLLVVVLALALWFNPVQNGDIAPVPAAQTEEQSDSLDLTVISPDDPAQEETESAAPNEAETQEVISEDGSYTTKEDVSAYLVRYGRLPDNFITKKEAREAGWNGGSLENILPGMCIGGDYFGNYEGLLPKAKGRQWRECDINTLGKSSRGAERLLYSNDGLIFYTDDHYESFTQLY